MREVDARLSGLFLMSEGRALPRRLVQSGHSSGGEGANARNLRLARARTRGGQRLGVARPLDHARVSRCGALLRNGQPCGRTVAAGSEFCIHHTKLLETIDAEALREGRIPKAQRLKASTLRVVPTTDVEPATATTAITNADPANVNLVRRLRSCSDDGDLADRAHGEARIRESLLPAVQFTSCPARTHRTSGFRWPWPVSSPGRSGRSCTCATR
jgi:hypothetical protein